MKYFTILWIMLISLHLFSADYSETRELKLAGEGIEQIVIDCGAGFLKLSGEKGLQTIQVSAEILARGIDKDDFEKFMRRNVELSLEKHGSKAVLKSKVENSFFNSTSGLINLTVQVPYQLSAKIDDGSGSIEVNDLGGDLYIDDGSGSTIVKNISGNVRVDDGSGSIDISNIGGALEVNDGSGSLDIVEVTGDLQVDDGSGSMNIRDIGGSVTITDGSGSIDIDGVAKDLNIREAGSGGLSVHNVKGTVEMED